MAVRARAPFVEVDAEHFTRHGYADAPHRLRRPGEGSWEISP